MKTFSELWKWINARGSVITVQEEHELHHIYDLMKACDCQSYLEVGTAEGNSLYVLGHAVKPDTHLFIDSNFNSSTKQFGTISYIDLCEPHTKAPRDEVVKILSENNKITEYKGDSTDPEFSQGKLIPHDCILIDGGHDFATVLSDSILYAPLATKYVFWHDIQLPEVRAAVEWFCKRWQLGEYSTFINSDSFGYAIVKVKS